ncbi:MAG: glycoside hydrolase family 26 protein [Solirubrobacterales bacterium]
MANRSSSRFVARVIWAAAAIFLLSAGIALASSGQPDLGPRKHAKLAEARALGGVKTCLRGRVDGRAKRINPSGVRRRCARKPAEASRTPEPIYWGAAIGDHVTGEQAPWDMSALTKFESEAGKSASLVHFFQPFADCSSECSFYPFPHDPMESIRAHGSIPVLSWSSQAIPSNLDSPDYQLGDVIEGRYDDFIREFAEEARDWGHPFFLRFNWEMNGNWFSWAEGVNGNTSGQYVAAWRHVHDIFAAVGATNVSWVWCPFVDPGGSLTDLASLYPGDEYVDWTGLDGYNWGTNPAAPRGWRSFDQLFADSYEEIASRIAPSKPLMIAEMGSSEQGGDKAAWIRDALARIPAAYPQVRALLWFDKFDDGMDWPIESSGNATAAFAEGIGQSAFVSANYGQLSGGSIQPPS